MVGELRWGILGTGGIAHMQTHDLVKNGFTVTAVGSRTIESATAFADEFSIPTAHGSYAELVADPDVDVIYVSTPHPFHAENALLALEAGKHVLIEKPFTLTGAEARRVVDTATAKNLVVLEAMWTRFLPHMIRIRELIAEGRIGEVRTVIAEHDRLLPTDPEHRINNLALGGGALLDLGIYPISFAFDILGTPDSVFAVAPLTETGVDRQDAIVFSYADGRQAMLHAALDTLGPNFAIVYGTKGRIEIAPIWYQPTSFTVYDADDAVVERFEQAVSQRGMQFQAWELERLVRDSRIASDTMPPEQSVTIMETLDEIRRQIGLTYPQELTQE